MNIDLDALGNLIAFWVIFMIFVGYKLGKKKTHHPYWCAIIGGITAFFPLFSFIFAIGLALKNDLPVNEKTPEEQI